MSKTQREYYLREQLKAIQKELGEGDERTQEIDELREKIEAAGMPEEAEKEALRELDRLAKMPPAAAEYTVARTYLDWLVALPWSEETAARRRHRRRARASSTRTTTVWRRSRTASSSTSRCKKIRPDGKDPILCFVGPPGVGKTSLGRSIARALGRKFVRISLGGMRDEAEIRGHRRTYIGALPGQIIQGLRRAGTQQPGASCSTRSTSSGMDFRGDPASALLEVLDPEQNATFRDHYLDVPFDLSQVLFITTANVLDTIPAPLRDRMEIIELAGYTEEEKVAIAQRHLVPKQAREHGLEPAATSTFTPRGAAPARPRLHARGRRADLEREIASVCRKVARRRRRGPDGAGGGRRPTPCTTFLGVPRFEFEELRGAHARARRGRRGSPGRRRAATSSSSRPRRMTGKRTLTAHRPARRRHEGVGAGRAVVGRARTPSELGIAAELLGDVRHPRPRAGRRHPQGRPVGGRHDGHGARLAADRARRCSRELAMTGEVTLAGRVLPVGGIKEKVLAAHRAGIRTVILPAAQREEPAGGRPGAVREVMTFQLADSVDEVLRAAFEEAPRPASEARRALVVRPRFA